MQSCMKAHIISLVNFKGGCTKTSSIIGIGAALALEEYRVLVVDCDPQGHAGVHLGVKPEDVDASIDNVLSDRTLNIKDIILETGTPGLCIAPSRKGLLHARQDLGNRPRRDALLSRALRPVVTDFDFILIDTPPDEGLLTVNAMYASRYIIIPTPLDTFSLMGISSLMDSFHVMKDAYEERELDILGVLVNRFDARTRKENASNLSKLTALFGDLVFDTKIRVDEEIRRAQRKGRTVFESQGGRAKGAFDFTRLADEIIERLDL